MGYPESTLKRHLQAFLEEQCSSFFSYSVSPSCYCSVEKRLLAPGLAKSGSSI
ncbi:hypothetical protein PILCRDRAFT_812491 [Piloderma croceum F 1598]|uniref:Uncharacterized protein n=1 Tax=Piloderma croceum (strain F 1598) TaxID=765440 RepID=A0A0C3GGB9_PILCF|nr:hypothetical protein PILCRDRAFT_812491 [Piloderma croceum F 1598]